MTRAEKALIVGILVYPVTIGCWLRRRHNSSSFVPVSRTVTVAQGDQIRGLPDALFLAKLRSGRPETAFPDGTKAPAAVLVFAQTNVVIDNETGALPHGYRVYPHWAMTIPGKLTKARWRLRVAGKLDSGWVPWTGYTTAGYDQPEWFGLGHHYEVYIAQVKDARVTMTFTWNAAR